MGYTTDFSGELEFNKELTEAQIKTINDFGQERHDGAGSKCPGAWCDWEVTEKYLWHNGGEKFYDYVEWLQHLIDNFFSKWGVLLNGEIYWSGEDSKDNGTIAVVDNIVDAESTGDKIQQLEEALDAVLSKTTNKLPLFMGINKLLDKKLKVILTTAASNPASTAALVLCAVIVTKFITL